MTDIRHCLLTAALATAAQHASSQHVMTPEKSDTYFAGVSYGGALAFGDDSYNIISDFNNACGSSLSVYVGKDFSRVFSARANVRYNKLYSRVNLETLSLRDLYSDRYGDMFPRDGFYGYSCYGLQIDAMFNPVSYIPDRSVDIFGLYLVGGVGVNVVSGYSDYVRDWSRDTGKLDGGWYEVDTATHVMPTVMIGGILDFRLYRWLHLDLQLDCTFTGDKLEGVVSQEFYDAYITFSAGLSAHF